MAVIFSLDETDFYLEVGSDDALLYQPRVMEVATLAGTERRQINAPASDISTSFDTELTDAELALLMTIVYSFVPLGISGVLNARSIIISEVSSSRLPNKNFTVKISYGVTDLIK